MITDLIRPHLEKPIGHPLKNVLQRSGKKDNFNIGSKKGFNQILAKDDSVWVFTKQISAIKRENLTVNWQMGIRNWFLGKVPYNSKLK